MLLSMLLSLLTARWFKGKIYVLFNIFLIIVLSTASIGVVDVQNLHFYLRKPIPVSYPFFASSIIDYSNGDSQKYLLHFIFEKFKVYPTHNFLLGDFVPLYSLFLLLNLVGVIIGYWISKTTFIDKLLKKGQNLFP